MPVLLKLFQKIAEEGKLPKVNLNSNRILILEEV